MTSSLRPQDSDQPSAADPSVKRPQRDDGDSAMRGASVKIVAGDVTWHVRPGWEWVVSGKHAPNWLHLVAEPQAEPVKRNAAREVWRVVADGHEFFTKVYRETGPVGKLRALFRGQGCVLEWRAGNHARRHGVATVETIAYGTVGWRGCAGPGILITKALTQALPLNDYWSEHVLSAKPDVRRRRANAVIEAGAAAVARAHQYGFHHRDLHAGNLLAVDGPDGRPTVVFVDLHNVRTRRRVPDTQALHNLAQLNQWFCLRSTRSDRLRFFRHYLAYREELSRRADSGPTIGMPYRDVAVALDRAIRRHSRWLWAKRDRVAMRDGKYYCRLRLKGGWRGHAYLSAKHSDEHSRASRMRFDREQWRRILANPLDLVRPDRSEVIKDSHTAYVCRAQLVTEQGPLEVVCKRARTRTWFKKCYHLFAGSRNMRNWRRGYQLLNRNLPTARPLAVLERRVGGLLLDSMVLTEALPGAWDFDAFLRTGLPDQDQRTVRRVKVELIEALVRLVKNMQSNGFGHHDFKAPNLMVQWDADSGRPPRLSLVDLDGLVLRGRLSHRECMRPLMRLNVSLDDVGIATRTDRLRFLKAYLVGPGRSGSDWKTVWREIGRMSDRKRVDKQKRREWKMKHYGRT